MNVSKIFSLIMCRQHLANLLLQMMLMTCVFPHALAGEPPTEPILRFDLGEHTAKIQSIASDEDGRYLVTASHDKTARVWSLADGRLLGTLRIPVGNGFEGKLDAVALSPDGKTVALGGYTQVGDAGVSIFLFDRASGRMLRRFVGLSGGILHLAFSPDGHHLAATLDSKNGLSLFSVAEGRLLAQDTEYGAYSYSVHFNPATTGAAAQLLTTSYDGFLRLYRFDGQHLTLLTKRVAPGGAQPFAARFSPDGKRIAVGFADTPAVNVLDAVELTLLAVPNTTGVNGDLGCIAWSRDGKTLIAAGLARKTFGGNSQTYLRRWSAGKFDVPLDEPVANGSIQDMQALPGGRVAFGSAEPAWGIVDEQGQRTLFHAPLVADFRNNQQGFTLSADAAQVRFSYELLGKSPRVFDSLSRAFLAADSAGLTPSLLMADTLNVTDWHNAVPKLNGSPLKLDQYEKSFSLALLPDGNGFVLGTTWSLRLFDRDGNQRWKIPAPSITWAVNVSQDGRWVVAAYGDGTIRWHRASDGAEQLAFFPHADKKRWVMWTPSGYYDASPGAEDLIGWHVNRGKDQAADFFPASRFRERFHRPDVLDKILDTQDEGIALRLANTESGRRAQTSSITNVLPPVVEILSPASDSAVSSTKIKIRYQVRSPADAPLQAMRVRVNGQPVSAERALKLTKTGNDAAEMEIEIPAQDSEVQLFAVNQNGVSTPAILRLSWAGKAAEEVVFKPKLYVLAVGVSKYKNADYNLGLAAKDATDFAAVFQKQQGKLYGEVVVKLLTDDKASKDDVLDGLEWLKQQVTAHDVGVMFLAGHGMNDNTGNFFYLPHNADPDKLMRTGVAQNDIKMTLNSLAGKAMFFVDTCHSGNALGSSKTRAIGGTTDAFVSELASAENGVIVFSSSTGKQLSQENPAWGNGAFTKAVVEGLSGKADFTKNGKITHKGLDYYVTERVKELTKGQQSPVSISPSGVTDYPIAIAGGGK
jgi:WD40 repeat protein